jgi:predicted amidophosphoribosyltransferase
MPFCPNCETEYKGHVSVCPECGEHLIDTSEEDLDDLSEEMDDDMVILYRSTSRASSDTLMDALKEAGINYVFKPFDDSAGARPKMGVKNLYRNVFADGEFFVSEDDFDTAKEIAESVLGDIEEDIP